MERNKRPVWLVRDLGQVETVDAEGHRTGHHAQTWAAPVLLMTNWAVSGGDAASSPFGTDAQYDLSLVLDKQIVTEGDRVYPGECPKNGSPEDAYEVVKVAPSLNSVAVGLTAVKGRV